MLKLREIEKFFAKKGIQSLFLVCIFTASYFNVASFDTHDHCLLLFCFVFQLKALLNFTTLKYIEWKCIIIISYHPFEFFLKIQWIFSLFVFFCWMQRLVISLLLIVIRVYNETILYFTAHASFVLIIKVFLINRSEIFHIKRGIVLLIKCYLTSHNRFTNKTRFVVKFLISNGKTQKIIKILLLIDIHLSLYSKKIKIRWQVSCEIYNKTDKSPSGWNEKWNKLKFLNDPLEWDSIFLSLSHYQKR